MTEPLLTALESVHGFKKVGRNVKKRGIIKISIVVFTVSENNSKEM